MPTNIIIVSGGQLDDLNHLIDTNDDKQLIIGVDAGAIALLKAGISVDLAIGDFDSITENEWQLLEQEAKEIQKLQTDKDLTDTEAALVYVAEEIKDVQTIKLFGLFGGRVDHMMSNLWLAYQPRFHDILDKIVILNKRNTLTFFHPGDHHLDKEDNKKYISFIGMTEIKELSLAGVKYPLNKANYSYPIALVSNEFQEHQMTFSFKKGLLAVIQSTD